MGYVYQPYKLEKYLVINNYMLFIWYLANDNINKLSKTIRVGKSFVLYTGSDSR